MKNSEFKRIKQKIQQVDPIRWWGDDYDVRFYLVNQLKKIKNKNILDIGGGIGIISSELDSSNFRINLDFSFDDLKKCKDKVDSEIETICASMTHLPFQDNVFDYVISANILEVAKAQDIKSNNVQIKNSVKEYLNVETVLNNANLVLKENSTLYITTPNNAYFQGNKMNYHELKNVLRKNFRNHKLWFYNSFPRLSKKSRKLNLANIFPKFLSKALNDEQIFRKMLTKDLGNEKNSVWFYVVAVK